MHAAIKQRPSGRPSRGSNAQASCVDATDRVALLYQGLRLGEFVSNLVLATLQEANDGRETFAVLVRADEPPRIAEGGFRVEFKVLHVEVLTNKRSESYRLEFAAFLRQRQKFPELGSNLLPDGPQVR
jgi:hypothetical protein